MLSHRALKTTAHLIGGHFVVENAFFSHEVAFFWPKYKLITSKGMASAIRFRIALQNKNQSN